MIDELDIVTLINPRAADGLATGDIGTVVMVHDGGKGSPSSSCHPKARRPASLPCRLARSGLRRRTRSAAGAN
jgi:hypothetical protein